MKVHSWKWNSSRVRWHASPSKFVFLQATLNLAMLPGLYLVVRSKPPKISGRNRRFNRTHTVRIWASLSISTFPCHHYIMQMLAAVLTIQQHILWYPVAFPIPKWHNFVKVRSCKVQNYDCYNLWVWKKTISVSFCTSLPQQGDMCTLQGLKWRPKQRLVEEKKHLCSVRMDLSNITYLIKIIVEIIHFNFNTSRCLEPATSVSPLPGIFPGTWLQNMPWTLPLQGSQ